MSGVDDGRTTVSRRQALAMGGVAAALTGGAQVFAADAKPILTPGSTVTEVPVSEGTNIAVAASPDGSMIAFDLLGLLWVVPVAGGAARRLTDDYADLAQPTWAPDGKSLVFHSYRSGNFHLWTVNVDGSGLRQLTTGINDHREASFSPDGKSLLFSSDRPGRYAIHLLDLASGAIRQVSQGPGQEAEPAFSRDGGRIAFVQDGARLMVADLTGKASVAASVTPSADRFRASEIHSPSFAPDGSLAYVTIQDGKSVLMVADKAMTSGEDVYPFKPSWLPGGDIVYASDGKIRRRARAGGVATAIAFSASAAVVTPSYPRMKRDAGAASKRPVVGIGSPMLSPDGKRIVFRALNDLWVLDIGKSAPAKLIAGADYKCDPAWSPDGRTLLYSSDRAGTLDLWLRDLAAGTDRQLTNLPNDAAVSGAWSRDAATIAFLNQEGVLHTVEVGSGAVRKVYDPLWEPGRPSFSPDGRTIAYAAFKPSSARYREGLSEILTVDRTTGKGTYQPVGTGKSLGTRGDDGPIWSPDGKHLAYVFASTLWIVPVGADGTFAGPPRQLTTEVTDAPSWSGDSATLLYLSNGKLRLVPAAGGAPKTVPCALTWVAARPAGRTLIAGARLWDGLGPRYREDVDVLLERGRIAALPPRGSATGTDLQRIDGKGLTLMPGLVDMHTHRQMQGYGYGDRMGRIWLAMGVTATRSPGCPAYHMVEDRESIDSGLRVAPRHYATGEAIDGSRIFYNFMRPVTEPGQMALELSRARALQYDMIKTYVRLDHTRQAEVIEAAHRMGLHVSSHYHYPSLKSGIDCMEHLGATSRYGYSRTVTALGAGHGDVTGLFAAAKAGRTPTLFTAGVLLADYPELVSDPRIRTLFPAWEYAKLEARAKAMTAGDRTPLLAALERNVDQVKDTIARGWHVVSGTDAPIDFVAISLHLNLRGMTRYGVSPYDALLTATRYSGEFLQEPLGLVKPGYYADLILVDGDPLTKIEDVAKVRTAFCNGVAHPVEALLDPFTRKQAEIAPSPLLEPVRVADAGSGYYWHSHDYVESSRGACCSGQSIHRHHHDVASA